MCHCVDRLGKYVVQIHHQLSMQSACRMHACWWEAEERKRKKTNSAKENCFFFVRPSHQCTWSDHKSCCKSWLLSKYTFLPSQPCIFLISYHTHLSIFRNRLELECWWKYLSGATVKNSSSFWKKTRLDIWGITTTTTMEYSTCNSSSEVWNTLGISNKKMCNVLREEE